MSVADLHDLELVWPSASPKDVIVTGTFDQWAASIHLVKDNAGFSGTVKVPWGQKVAYKFIVDGRWRCRDDWPQEGDGHGNINNVLQTPEKPAVPHPPARLSIPLEGAQNDGHGDEMMVTAVEFLPPAEPATTKGSLPLLIPQIALSSAASESKLDTAGATEGTVSPASDGPAGLGPSKLPTSHDSVLPINGSVSLPVNDAGEAHNSHGFATYAPIQFTKGELPASPSVPEAAKDAALAPSGSAAPQPNHSPQAAQDAPAVTDRTDVPPAPIPIAALEPTKQPDVDSENPVLGHRQQATAPAATERASAPSTPSSTLTHKKRRSLLARIKHIFDKDKGKQESKEKHKH